MPLSANMMGGGFSAGQVSAIQGASATVAAAGTTAATGTLLGVSQVIVTAADGTKGVTLPAASPGDSILIFNSAGSTLKVWPPTSAGITVVGTGLGTVDAAHSLLTFKTGRYTCFSGVQWFVEISA